MTTGGALIGALRVTLGLDSANFEAGSKRARQTAQRDALSIQKALDGVKGRLNGLYAGLAGGAIIAAGKRALDYAANLGEVAAAAGVTTTELQEMYYAGTQVNLSQAETETILARLTKTMGQALSGQKAQVETFRELNLALKDSNGRVYTAAEMIPKLADALQKYQNPADRARYLTELFGRSGQKLEALLAGGSKGVNELRDAAHRLGVVLSEKQIQDADVTADKLAAVKMVLEARIASVVSDNAASILSLANALATLTSRFIQFAQSNPEKTLGLIGAAAGALRGGPIGAGIGLVAGSAIGRKMGQTSADSNMDLQFRKSELQKARREYEARQKGAASNSLISFRRTGSSQSGGTVAQAEAELRRQTALLVQATSAAGKAVMSPVVASIGDGELPTIAGGGGGRKSSARPGPTPAEIEAKHQQELSRLRQDALQAELQLTNDAERRAELQSQLLLEEFNERSAQIANDEDFTVEQKKAQQAALKALYGVSGDGNNIVVGSGGNTLGSAISRDLIERLDREALDLRMDDLEAKRNNLQSQYGLARTSADRRRIEQEILDIEYDLRKAKLDHVINSQESSRAEKELAQIAKDRLAGQRALDGANVDRQNMGPLATYMDSLPRTAAEVDEAFEQIAANGLANMNDQLAAAAANTLKLKGLAGQLFNQIIADVIRLNLQRAMGGGGLLGGLLRAGSTVFGGGGLGGVSSAAMSSINAQAAGLSARAMPGLARGGTIGGLPGIDNNVLAINGIPTARVSANERIRVEPNSANDNGGRGGNVRIEVVEGALFRPVVSQISGGVSAQTVASAAPSISGGTQKAIGRANSRRLA